MNLPIPQTRAGMFAALILTIVMFWVYYGVYYDKADRFYKAQYNPTTPAANSPIYEKKLDLNLRIPKYISASIPGWVYGSLTNNSDEVKEVDVSLSLVNEDIVLIPPYYGKEMEFKRYISNLVIPPHSTVYFRLPWSGSIKNNSQIIFYIDKMPVELKDDVKTTEQNTINVLKRAVVENLFLPPWSNLILPSLAFVFCYLAEDKWFEKRKFNCCSVLYVFIGGILEALFFYLLVLSLLATNGLLLAILGSLGWLILLLVRSLINFEDVLGSIDPQEIVSQ